MLSSIIIFTRDFIITTRDFIPLHVRKTTKKRYNHSKLRELNFY